MDSRSSVFRTYWTTIQEEAIRFPPDFSMCYDSQPCKDQQELVRQDPSAEVGTERPSITVRHCRSLSSGEMNNIANVLAKTSGKVRFVQMNNRDAAIGDHSMGQDHVHGHGGAGTAALNMRASAPTSCHSCEDVLVHEIRAIQKCVGLEAEDHRSAVEQYLGIRKHAQSILLVTTRADVGPNKNKHTGPHPVLHQHNDTGTTNPSRSSLLVPHHDPHGPQHHPHQSHHNQHHNAHPHHPHHPHHPQHSRPTQHLELLHHEHRSQVASTHGHGDEQEHGHRHGPHHNGSHVDTSDHESSKHRPSLMTRKPVHSDANHHRMSNMFHDRNHPNGKGRQQAGTKVVNAVDCKAISAMYLSHGAAYIAARRYERDAYWQQVRVQEKIKARLTTVNDQAGFDGGNMSSVSSVGPDNSMDDDLDGGNSTADYGKGGTFSINDSLVSSCAEPVSASEDRAESGLALLALTDRSVGSSSTFHTKSIDNHGSTMVSGSQSLAATESTVAGESGVVQSTVGASAAVSASTPTSPKNKPGSKNGGGGGIGKWLLEKARLKRQEQESAESKKLSAADEDLDEPVFDAAAVRSQIVHQALERIKNYRQKMANLQRQTTGPETDMEGNATSIRYPDLTLSAKKVLELSVPTSVAATTATTAPTAGAIVFVSGNANLAGPHTFRGHEYTSFERYPISIKGYVEIVSLSICFFIGLWFRGDLRDLVFDRDTLTLHVLDIRSGIIVEEQALPLAALFVTESKYSDMVTLRTMSNISRPLGPTLASKIDQDNDVSKGWDNYIGTVNRSYWNQLANLMADELETAITTQLKIVERVAAQPEQQVTSRSRKRGVGMLADDDEPEPWITPAPAADVMDLGSGKWDFTTLGEPDANDKDITVAVCDTDELLKNEIRDDGDGSGDHVNRFSYNEGHRKHRRLKLTWSEAADKASDTMDSSSNHLPDPTKPVAITGRHHLDIFASLHRPYNYSTSPMSYPNSVAAHLATSPALKNCTHTVRTLIKDAVAGMQGNSSALKRLQDTQVSSVDGRRPGWLVTQRDTVRGDGGVVEREDECGISRISPRGTSPVFDEFKERLLQQQKEGCLVPSSSTSKQETPTARTPVVKSGTTYAAGYTSFGEEVHFLVDGQNSRPASVAVAPRAQSPKNVTLLAASKRINPQRQLVGGDGVHHADVDDLHSMRRRGDSHGNNIDDGRRPRAATIVIPTLPPALMKDGLSHNEYDESSSDHVDDYLLGETELVADFWLPQNADWVVVLVETNKYMRLFMTKVLMQLNVVNVEVFGTVFEAAHAMSNRSSHRRYSGVVLVSDKDLQQCSPDVVMYAVAAINDLTTKVQGVTSGPSAGLSGDEIHCSDQVLTTRLLVYGAAQDPAHDMVAYKDLVESCWIPLQHRQPPHHGLQHPQPSSRHAECLPIGICQSREHFLRSLGVWSIIHEPLDQLTIKVNCPFIKHFMCRENYCCSILCRGRYIHSCYPYSAHLRSLYEESVLEKRRH
jgi:hypothetical protein